METVETPRLVGDQPPPSLEALVAALVADRPQEAARSFAADGWYAYGADRGDEKAPRTTAAGAGLASALAADLEPAALLPELAVCLTDGRDCLLEARLVERGTRAAAATLLASCQLDAAGSLTRALTFRIPPVEASGTWDGLARPTAHDARAVLDRYFELLDAADFPGAADCFSADVLYSHPPYWPGSPRAEFRGRAALLAGFEARGPRRNHHEITACLQRGPECILEGYSHRTAAGGTGQFVSSLTLDDDGRIRRYASAVFEPAVGRR